MKRLLMFCLLLLVTILARESIAAHRPFKAAVLQFNPILNERDKNIEALADVFEEAMKNGARLIVAPEMSTTGYHYANRKAIAALPARAIQNGLFIVSDNRSNTENNFHMIGGSGIYTLDPLYGLDQPEALENGERAFRVNFRTVQPEWWFNQEMLINSRRSVYYKPLVLE
jgi:hypothetical protein